MLEDVGVEREDRLEVLLRERRVVMRVVIAGTGVVACTGLAHNLAVFLRRIVGRAPEHQVLEEVSEAGLPRLYLVARTRLNRDLYRHEVWKAGGHDNHFEAVRQR